ncbi:MAG: flagellar filament capping protein FliD, partial [Eubacteriales bacterium]
MCANTMRVSGLFSGLKTDDIISKLMQVERQPVTLMTNRKHTYELRKGLWNEINSSLLSLKNKVSDLVTGTSLTQMKAVSSDDTMFTANAGPTAANSTYNINVTTLAKAQRVVGTVQGTGALNLSGSFNIGDGTYTATINVSASDTLGTIMSRINSAVDNTDPTKKVQVTASIVNNTLILQHNKTGSANQMVLQDTVNTPGVTGTNEILESLGILTDTKAIKSQQQAATDAQFTVNGISVTRSGNTGLTDVINGVSLNLKKEGVTGTITVSRDVDAGFNAIKAWVDQYNSTMDLVNTRMSEDPVKDAISDVGLSKGLLRGDSILSNAKNQFRLNTSKSVTGLTVYKNLSQIGITTSSDDYGRSGHLVIDEVKLRAALGSNPNDVAQLFTNNADMNGDGKVTTDEKGIAVRLSEQIDFFTSTSTKSISGKSVKTGAIAAELDAEDKVINDYTK